jgi:chromosomal replication initiation ATPase DnaA
LWGPAGCGKSHLAHIYCERSGGILLPAARLCADDVPVLADYPAVVVEDADQGVDEAALFHLFNLVRETGHFLLLTGCDAPARWTIALPDLRSRLSAIQVAAIRPPDDGLLEAVLVKLFADRQLRVGQDVLAFILARMERSFAAARALVATIDDAALAERREISVALARKVLSVADESAATDRQER